MRILELTKLLNVIYVFCLVIAFLVSNNEGREIIYAVGTIGIGFLTYLIEIMMEKETVS